MGSFAVYLVLGIAFYFLPQPRPPGGLEPSRD
jgi:hypothetical protein